MHRSCVAGRVYTCPICRVGRGGDVWDHVISVPAVDDHGSESSGIEVPDVVVVCCPRLGPPPDFVPLSDARAYYSTAAMEWQCYSCMKTLGRDEFEDEIARTPGDTIPTCWAHGLMKPFIDMCSRNWGYICTHDRVVADDVPMGRENCPMFYAVHSIDVSSDDDEDADDVGDWSDENGRVIADDVGDENVANEPNEPNEPNVIADGVGDENVANEPNEPNDPNELHEGGAELHEDLATLQAIVNRANWGDELNQLEGLVSQFDLDDWSDENGRVITDDEEMDIS